MYTKYNLAPEGGIDAKRADTLGKRPEPLYPWENVKRRLVESPVLKRPASTSELKRKDVFNRGRDRERNRTVSATTVTHLEDGLAGRLVPAGEAPPGIQSLELRGGHHAGLSVDRGVARPVEPRHLSESTNRSIEWTQGAFVFHEVTPSPGYTPRTPQHERDKPTLKLHLREGSLPLRVERFRRSPLFATPAVPFSAPLTNNQRLPFPSLFLLFPDERSTDLVVDVALEGEL